MKLIRVLDNFSNEVDGMPMGITNSDQLIRYIRTDLIDEISIGFHEDDGGWFSVDAINYNELDKFDKDVVGVPRNYCFGAFDTFAEAKAKLAELVDQLNADANLK